MTGARDPLLTVAATFTADPVEATLRYWIEKLETGAEVEFAPYDQVFQQLLDPTGSFHSDRTGLNVILLRLEDWATATTSTREPLPADSPNPERNLERGTAEFIDTCRTAAERIKRPTLVMICPSSPEVERDLDAALRSAEAQLEGLLSGIPGIQFVSRAKLLQWYPIERYHNASDARLGHVPYTPEFYAGLGTGITRVHEALRNPPRKVIVLDCDMTLWRGVCGEDGPAGVVIDAPHEALQRFMVERHDEGMLLCLCSKNEEADVLETFAFHAAMPLRKEHIVAQRINWKSKPENLKSLAEELNLGLDSFIFVDDNSIECAEVEASCPEVLAIRLPTAPEELPLFLNHVWAFDRPHVTDLDRRRTELYRAESHRTRASAAARSLAEFIDGLQLDIRISALAPEQLDRAAQLTFRTNQLNLSTIRRSSVDLRELCKSGGHEGLIVDVTDRFGDYGTVGVMLYREVGSRLDVDTFLLSCRVLGRGVEHRMAAELGRIATARGLGRVDLHYQSSRKNQVALRFLRSIAPDFGQPEAEGPNFHVPAGFLSRVSYQPSDERPASHGARPAASTDEPRADLKTDSGLQRWIAAETSAPERIHKAVQDSQRRLRVGVGAQLVAPRTEIEGRIAAIWSEVLGVEEVGVQDNFFRLGGDSLSMTRVIARVLDAFDAEISFEAFFEAPTVAALAVNAAQHGSSEAGSAPRPPEAPIPRRPRRRISSQPLGSAGSTPRNSTGESQRDTASARKSDLNGAAAVNITTLGMVTCDREELLLRGLRSYIDNGLRHARSCRYAVMDDTGDPAARERTRGLLRALASEKGADIHYAGREEKERFAEALIRADELPPEVVQLALFGSEVLTHTTGANRNALLLDSIDEALLSVDDDTLCQISASGDEDHGVAATAGEDPAEFWYYADRESALGSVEFIEADLLELHERLLGKSVNELLGGRAASVELPGTAAKNGAGRAFRERLASDKGRVAFTTNGLVGDCGLNAPFGYWNSAMGNLLLDPASEERMLQSEAAYQMASCSREIQRSVKRPFVTDHSFSMTTFMGLDNRELLPPFIPILGEDFAYGTTLWTCVQDAFFGHLPWTLVHAPIDRRQFWPGEIQRTASGIDMARLFIDCINACEFAPGERGRAARIQTLGQHLTTLGTLPLAEYEEFVRTRVAATTAELMALIEENLGRSQARPGYWVSDAESYLDKLRQASRKADYIVPLELRRHRSLDEARGLSQKVVRELGRLLYWWPKIHGVTRDLKTRGVRLSSVIS